MKFFDEISSDLKFYYITSYESVDIFLDLIIYKVTMCHDILCMTFKFSNKNWRINKIVVE